MHGTGRRAVKSVAWLLACVRSGMQEGKRWGALAAVQSASPSPFQIDHQGEVNAGMVPIHGARSL